MNEIINKCKRYWISSLALFLFLIPFNFSFANEVSANPAIVEICQTSRNVDNAELTDEQLRIIKEDGVVCADDYLANAYYAIFGMGQVDEYGNYSESYGTEILKNHGYEVSEEVQTKAIANIPIKTAVFSTLDYLILLCGGIAILITVAKIIIQKAVNEEVKINYTTGIVFVVVTGVLSMLMFPVIGILFAIAILWANKFSATFNTEIKTNNNNGIITDQKIMDIAAVNANEAMAMKYQAHRTEKIKQLSFNKIFTDEADKGLTSVFDRDIDLGGARDRVLTETPFTWGVSKDGEFYMELLSFQASYRTHIESYSIIKNNKERIFDYNYDWYGRKGTAGVMKVNNTTKDYDGKFFATNDADNNQSVIQEIAEQTLLQQSGALAGDSQLAIMADILRRYAEKMMAKSGNAQMKLSDLDPSVIQYFEQQLKPYLQSAVSQAESVLRNENDLAVFAFMMTGQLAAQTSGATFTEIVNDELGVTEEVRPRFMDILDEFGGKFAEQIDISNCSGKANYMQYVAPYKSKVELYNTLPDTTLQSEREKMGIDWINTNCVKIKPNGLELIGSISTTDQEEAFKKAATEKLALQLFFAGIQKAAVNVVTDYLEVNNKSLLESIRYGGTRDFINAAKLQASDERISFGKAYITDIISYEADADYSVPNYYANNNVMFLNNASARYHNKEMKDNFNLVDLSSIMRSGTIMHRNVNSNYNVNESNFIDKIGSVEDFIEALFFIDFKGFKMMGCLDPEKTLYRGLLEKQNDYENYLKNDYPCADIFTAMKLQGQEFIQTAIRIKLIHGMIKGYQAASEMSEEVVANITNSKAAAKGAKFMPVKLLGDVGAATVGAYLDQIEFAVTTMLAVGIIMEYIIPMNMALLLISLVLAMFEKTILLLVTFPTETFRAAVHGKFLEESPYSLITIVWKDTIALMITLALLPSIFLLGFYVFLMATNALPADIMISMATALVAVENGNPLNIFLMYVVFTAVASFFALYWVNTALRTFTVNLIARITEILNKPVQVNNGIDKGLEQAITAYVGSNFADTGKSITGQGTKKIVEMRRRVAERLKNKQHLPQTQQGLNDRNEPFKTQPSAPEAKPETPKKGVDIEIDLDDLDKKK
jgi:hypothetical protein